MKSPVLIIILSALAALAANAQTKAAGQFPGVTPTQLRTLQGLKRTVPIALPAWVPAGFKLEKIRSKLGRGVRIYERDFALIYTKRLAGGKVQTFALEAGFDGLGDLMYDGAKTLKTSLGNIYLLYEPRDPDNGNQKMENYVMTEWFSVGNIAYHYIGMYGYENGDTSHVMISLADTERILRSLKRL